ncbi:response regulator [Bacillus massiliglaciei]|uniref:response regulator n=1 Tax=Bacillus massiliglaciei TaxID=1816693 RepID=UPI000AECFF3B|nr:response regulator [Bacillus massiliglaciei]
MSRVLIVDDAKFIRETIAQILQKAEFQIVGEAENGFEAISLYRTLKPDLVIMDITMPHMSGIDAVKEIKKEYPAARIIMCSAIGQQRMVIEALEAGARDFIIKPFDEIGVLESIRRVFS